MNATTSDSHSSPDTTTAGNTRYELFPKQSIQLIAEQNGFKDVADEGILVLSEDVTYRVRQLVQNSIEFMRHSKRRRLTANDVNRALLSSNSEPIYGFEANDSPISTHSFIHKKAKIFANEDPVIDLNEELNEILDKNNRKIKVFEKDIQLKVEWLSADCSVECSDVLKDYYDIVVKAILGTDRQSLVSALYDLSDNSRISPILSFLVNFIRNGIEGHSHDIRQMKRFLNTIECLFRNPSLNLSTDPYLTVLIDCILQCIVGPLEPNSDHWALRDFASHLLVNVLKQWFTPFVGNRLIDQTVDCLCDCLLDFSLPFSSHYGAITAFRCLGFDIIVKHLYPIVDQYLSHLLPSIDSNCESIDLFIRRDGLMVLGQLLLIGELISLKLLSIVNNNIETEIDFKVYNELSDIFGDSLFARLSIGFTKTNGKVVSKNTTNLLEKEKTLQTGEQLLAQFYESPKPIEDMGSDSSTIEYNSWEESFSTIDDKKGRLTTTFERIEITINEPEVKNFTKLKNRSLAPNSEPIFESISLKQTPNIRFNISNWINRPILKRRAKPVVQKYPSKWFVLTMTDPNDYSLRTKFKILKNENQLHLFSGNILNEI